MAIDTRAGIARLSPRDRRIVAAIAVLTLLRFGLGVYLPLSFDEAYYWLWSKHLAASYYDHPPAIAYAIRAGTMILGDTSIGVRLVPLLLSVVASWCVWRAGEMLLGDEHAAALACLYFNLTLMVAVETMAATPDAPALETAALLLFTLAKLVQTGDGRWWIAIGVAGGLCLLSKYTGFFLGAGVLFWLIASAEGRRWLPTFWPYAGGVLAVLIFSPVIAWNAAHDWISFKFQFGRVASGGLTARFFGEFFLAQAALASPFILVLGVAGFTRASRIGRAAPPVVLCAALMWPAVVYFLVHATHDRVQGNWPSFLFPAFALLAAYASHQIWTGRIARPTISATRMLAIPVAALMLVFVYAQAFFGFVHTRDPIGRLTAFGMEPVISAVRDTAAAQGAQAVITTSYATTSWLAFYLKPRMPVVQINEDFRWLSAPRADPALADGPLLFVTAQGEKTMPVVASRFAQIRHVGEIDRRRKGVLIERYDLYRVTGFRGGTLGRAP
ncbi:MAG TPA: glycosyltransferase family 39 protein [Rhizomicrobium sp.]|nr:glycosyltransferase family 39 protein [Rhizomicrobium sp.]